MKISLRIITIFAGVLMEALLLSKPSTRGKTSLKQLIRPFEGFQDLKINMIYLIENICNDEILQYFIWGI